VQLDRRLLPILLEREIYLPKYAMSITERFSFRLHYCVGLDRKENVLIGHGKPQQAERY